MTEQTIEQTNQSTNENLRPPLTIRRRCVLLRGRPPRLHRVVLAARVHQVGVKVAPRHTQQPPIVAAVVGQRSRRKHVPHLEKR
jgi:malonyl CoA-acyl carrier protein transacylase